MATRRTYDTYTGIGTICTTDDLKKLQNIYVEIFGLSKNESACRSFIQTLSSLFHISGRNTPLLSIDTKLKGVDSNGFSVINIHSDFKFSKQQMPDVIFQSKNVKRDTVIISGECIKQGIDNLQNEYNKQRETGNCALCGKPLQRNTFIYQKDGKYYGRSCYEKNIANDSLILNSLSMLFFLNEIKKQIINQKEPKVIGVSLSELSDEFKGDTLKKRAFDILSNNEYTKKDFSQSELKHIAGLTIEKMFFANFVGITKDIKVTDEVQKKILNTSQVDLSQVFVNHDSKGINFSKLTNKGYIQRMDLNGSLTVFFNTYSLVSTLLGEKGKKELEELEALIPEFERVSEENDINKYVEIMSKITPLINKGIKQAPNSDMNVLPKWFIATKVNKEIEKSYELKKFDFGSKQLYICCKK